MPGPVPPTGIMTDIPTSIIVSVTDLVTHDAMRWLARRSRRRPIDRELVYAQRNLMEVSPYCLDTETGRRFEPNVTLVDLTWRSCFNVCLGFWPLLYEVGEKRSKSGRF